jgi:UDP-N-acetylmuramoyl-L-alanyl-D-glutamate--2,6-diaminopimelate ligase
VDLHELLAGFSASLDFPGVKISGLTSHSGQVKKGDLFVAQSGLTRHAIDFVADAVKAGAVAVLYDAQDSYCLQRIPLLRKQLKTLWVPVNGLNKVTGEIASRFFGYPGHQVKLVGITGTDGKTSVTHLLVQALTRMNLKAGSIGTLGYGVSNHLKMTSYTTPDAITLQSLLSELQLAGSEYVVMEVSSHALEQYRVNGCRFDIAVLTNLGSDHLDYHETLEQYAQAKSMLFEFPGLAARVLNVEDDLGQRLLQQNSQMDTVSYSARVQSGQPASVKLKHSRMTEKGLQISVQTGAGSLTLQTGLIGSFNIDNCLACISVLMLLGFDLSRIEQSMQGIKPIPGRMEYFPSTPNQAAAVVDFAHTAQALEACLNALKDYTDGELYCVFGCGGDRDQSKRPLMGSVAERLADHVILTDDNPRSEPAEKIMQDILAGFKKPQKVRVIHDREKAIQTAMHLAQPQDLVVVAGKGHEQIQIVGENRLAFSDHKVLSRLRQRSAQ